MTDRYAAFDRLLFDRPAPFVLRITLNRPEKLNAFDHALHEQVERVWAAVDEDPEVRVSIITGAGRGFCAGADIGGLEAEERPDPMQSWCRDFNSGSRMVYNLMHARKPVISAINGAAAGAGLALALMADIPIAAKTAKLLDGHTRIGVAAGDHAAMVWPLAIGMAKTKYFLMTNESINGEDAERMGLVALAVDLDQLQARAVEVATKIAETSPTAIRITKYCMNHWYKQHQTIFDLSLAMELVGFHGRESQEAISALANRRKPNFDMDCTF
ncbi:MAG: enoyl-CoA hydratase/isomerase family protein [Gammaproteobacteria bacterium]